MTIEDAPIAVLGAGGMLGTDLLAVCEKQGIDVNGFDLPEFDITVDAQLKKIVADHKIIINCAAYTNVEKAESEPDIAYKVNAEAVGHLGEFVKKAGAWLCHISTDFVFDGKADTPYVETDTPNPIGAYGATKLAGERLFAASGAGGCIIRIQWTYGMGGNNFVKKLIDIARKRKDIKVVDDQVGSPTATTEVAAAIVELLSAGKLPDGIFHFAADGYVSRCDMAGFIFDKLGLKVNLTACKTADFPSAAVRPLSSRFDCGRIQKLLSKPIKGWQGPLERFLEKL